MTVKLDEPGRFMTVKLGESGWFMTYQIGWVWLIHDYLGLYQYRGSILLQYILSLDGNCKPYLGQTNDLFYFSPLLRPSIGSFSISFSSLADFSSAFWNAGELEHFYLTREKIAEQNRARQAREIASNSDWFGQSTAFDSMLQQQQHHQQQQQQQQQHHKMRMEAREDLPHLLTSQGLAKYADIFLRHEIDLPTFATLTDDELKEIGIPTFGRCLLVTSQPALFIDGYSRRRNNLYSCREEL